MAKYDAVVVGSGPNGLAAAIAVAERGGSVLLVERAEELGGGMRSAELLQPGVIHDLCSSAYPMAIASPFLGKLPLEKHGLRWVHSPAPVAHPLDDGRAVVLKPSLDETVDALGRDGKAYRKLIGPFVGRADGLFAEMLQPMLHFPKHPALLAHFGMNALRPAHELARALFREEPARALFAGVAGHAMIPLTWWGSSAIAMALLVAGHGRGWPLAGGGAGQLTAALASYLRSLGGEIQTGFEVRSLRDLPESRHVFLNVTPAQFVRIAGDRLSASQRRPYQGFRHGTGIFKMDFVLSGPIPWLAPECATAATVHLGATLDEITHAEKVVRLNQVAEWPYVLLIQPSLFDPARAPQGVHTAWAYCRVPYGSTLDMSEPIEAQIDRFAPGFRRRIVGKRSMSPKDFEEHNPNYAGGDIGAGSLDLAQLIARPKLSLHPYATPLKDVYLCSASTPPGPGVHGMCGYLAVRAALG